MIQVAIITQEQRDSLVGEYIYGNVLFNLECKDINDDFYISQLVISQCDIQWLKDLSLTDFQPKLIQPLF